MIEALTLGQIQDVCTEIRRCREAGHHDRADRYQAALGILCSAHGCTEPAWEGRWCATHRPHFDRPVRARDLEPIERAIRVIRGRPAMTDREVADTARTTLLVARQARRAWRRIEGVPPVREPFRLACWAVALRPAWTDDDLAALAGVSVRVVREAREILCAWRTAAWRAA